MIYCTRLRTTGKKALYRAEDPELRPGETVIAEVDTGLDTAVILYRKEDQEEGSDSIPSIRRRATPEDLRQMDENRRTEAEGRFFCIDRIRTRDLPMKLVSTSLTFDRKKFSFYFTAEKRVDFRDLVKDLASKFRTRIELRQIGIRDEAKLVGGIGCCGREVCCKLFLTQFAPISIKMAKGQDIALNPTKISGLCGRLMCCLNYEYVEPAKKGRRKDAGPPMESVTTLNEETDLPPDIETRTVEVQTEERLPEMETPVSGPAEESAEQAQPVPKKPAGEPSEPPGRRSKRRRGRRGKGQKARTTDQQASGPSGAGAPPTGTEAPPAPAGQQGPAPQSGQRRRPKRRRKKKPTQEQK